MNLRDATDQLQRQFIQQLLSQTDGNWTASAHHLQIDSGNLDSLAKRLGIK